MKPSWAGRLGYARKGFTLETGLFLVEHETVRAAFERSGPILLFDNDCGVCSRFARLVRRGSRNWVETVGLSTSKGLRVKREFFEVKDNPDEMFWLLIGDTGFGGRSGLLPLAREVVRGRVL